MSIELDFYKKRKYLEVIDTRELEYTNLRRIESAEISYDYGDSDISWNTNNRGEYERIEQEIRDFSITRPKYEIITWCDASGYDYWGKDYDPNEECSDINYVTITVHFKAVFIYKADLLTLSNDLDEAYTKFSGYDVFT